MSIDEKRHEVTCYCDSAVCAKCVLNRRHWVHECGSLGNACLSIGDANEDELDRALELINGLREPEPTAQLEQITEDFDTVIKISSSRKIKSVIINFEEDTSNA